MTQMSLLQRLTENWVRRIFGMAFYSPANRAIRLLEEAAELCQAEGISQELCLNQVISTYLRPVGEPRQELGGVMITAMAYAAARNWDLESVAADELERILSLPPEKFRKRNAEKKASGLTVNQ